MIGLVDNQAIARPGAVLGSNLAYMSGWPARRPTSLVKWGRDHCLNPFGKASACALFKLISIGCESMN
jgi:hypothetical protein